MSKTMRILKQTVKNTAGFKTSLVPTSFAFFNLHFTHRAKKLLPKVKRWITEIGQIGKVH